MSTDALAEVEQSCRAFAQKEQYRVNVWINDGRPVRRLDVDELAAYLGRRDTPASTRDAIWSNLVDRTRGPDPNWTLIAIRLAFPGIRRAIARAHPILPTFSRGELEAEAVCAFTEALKVIDPDGANLCSKLCQKTSSTLRTFLRDQLRDIKTATQLEFESHLPPKPYGHVDLVLNDAVRDGIITLFEAQLIGSVRIYRVGIKRIADNLGVARIELNLTLKIAEHRLIRWMQND